MPLERDINIAVNCPFWVEVANPVDIMLKRHLPHYPLLQAFWLLDHEDYEEAVNMLLDPLISGNDIEAWQHRAVLVSLLAQGHPKLALKYSRIRKPPLKDLADIQVTRYTHYVFTTAIIE